jgi:hypothetical protein
MIFGPEKHDGGTQFHLRDYISRPYLPIPEDAEFTYNEVTGENPNLYCCICQQLIGEAHAVWVGSQWLLHIKCGGSRRVSRGYTHRCIECSLMRCAGEGHRCEECAEHIARTGT